MPDEPINDSEESEAKPTITIAEKQGGENAAGGDKPTITIAEKTDNN